MNKRYNLQRFTAIILMLFALNACEDVLDEVPSTLIPIDRILDKSTVQNFRSNSYNQLNSTFTNWSSGQLLETYTDDAFRAGTGITFDWHSGQLSPDRSMFAGAIWNSSWLGIRRCNLAIEYLPQSEVSTDLIPEEDIERWFDEVKILRVFYHFELIRHFGPLPFIDEAFSPDFTGWNELTRPTYDEITSILVSEIDEVINKDLLPMRWQVSSEYSNVNMAVAYALKSRILLYNASTLNNPDGDVAKWQAAANAAQSCIDNITSDYSLLPIGEYNRLFSEAVNVLNSEIIWRSGNNGAGVMNNLNGVDLSAYGSPTQAANSGAVPTQELVDCFELQDGSLPVASYNADHTNPIFNSGYTENEGDDPYANRDARLAYSILFNGGLYGKYKGMSAAAPELAIYTYDGRAGTGFNNSPLSQEEVDQRRSATGYYGKKFRSAGFWGAQTGGPNAHVIYFRLAEIYLNLAEAQCEANNLDPAITALNVIRERAGQPRIEDVPGYAKTKDFLLERIRNERRVELCFEGHRFYDQRRWEIIEQTNDVVTGMKITSSNNTDTGLFSYERVEIDVPRNATADKYLILPLPIEEARRLEGIGQPSVWN